MLLWFTEARTQNKMAINPEYVVAVFTSNEGDFSGKTVISVTNGQVAIEEEILETIGRINGAMLP